MINKDTLSRKNDNRIIFLTDAQPNREPKNLVELLSKIASFEKPRQIFVTFIGKKICL